MTLEAMASIGEIIGAFAVVISVCYLAVQIRKQTLESRLSATRELATQHLDLLRVIATDDALPEIWLKAIVDYDSLRDAERLKASLIFHDMLRVYEQQFIHIRAGHADGSYLDSINRVFLDFLTFPGVQEWWESSRHAFDDAFENQVDLMIKQAGESRLTSPFGTINENST